VFFENGTNKAIRIPKQLEFDAKEVSIERDGDRLIVTPLYVRKTWASLAKTEPASDNFVRAAQLVGSSTLTFGGHRLGSSLRQGVCTDSLSHQKATYRTGGHHDRGYS
jgi:virulence-associated protein VagC